MKSSHSWSYMNFQSRDFMSSHNRFYLQISTFAKANATNHGKMVIYCGRIPHINSHDPFKIRLRKVMWKIKNIITLLSKWLWPINFLRWLPIARSPHQYIRMTPQLGAHRRSRKEYSLTPNKVRRWLFLRGSHS